MTPARVVAQPGLVLSNFANPVHHDRVRDESPRSTQVNCGRMSVWVRLQFVSNIIRYEPSSEAS